jgi:N-acetylmuramoyl-L-alanine amidase
MWWLAVVGQVGLSVLTTPMPEGWTNARVVIDAGHGAVGNSGTTDALCRAEQEHTKATQDAVAQWLRQQPGIDIAVGRPDESLVSYRDRIKTFTKWKADAVISIHSDARAADGWWRDGQSGCWRSRGGTGFAVLYSDEGNDALAAARLSLAVATSTAMIEAGFHPYHGADYEGLYEQTHPGVFVDRHTPKQRIMMLRRTTMPVVIVETHQAADEHEATMWAQPETQAAFAAAIYRAVVTVSP